MKKSVFFISLLLGTFILFHVNCYATENNGSNENIEKSKTIIKEIKDNFPPNRVNKEKGYVEGEAIVKFKPSFVQSLSSLSNEEIKNKLFLEIQKLNIKIQHIKRLGPNSNLFLIRTDDKEETFESIKSKLLNNPDIEHIEPNYIYKLNSIIPNDFKNFEPWGILKIHAPEAWDITTGSSNVVVAVIDTGVDYTHEDLEQNMWGNPLEIPDNGIDDDGDGYIDNIYGIAPGFYNNIKIGDPMDSVGHGTHVAGIIGAIGDNGKGVVGVNWNIRILSCNAASPSLDYMTNSNIIECYKYIANLKDSGENIKVVNASFSSDYYSYDHEEAIKELKDRGILLVTAAGNDGQDNDIEPKYPCNYDLDNIICIASTDTNDNLSVFSNYGEKSVHVAAPGEKIYSTYPITYKNFDLSLCNEIFYEDFESGTGNWEFESPSGLSTKYSVSPTHSITDSIEGNYPNDKAIPIVSEKIDLSLYRHSKVFGYFSVRPYLATTDMGCLVFAYDNLHTFFTPFIKFGKEIDTQGLRGVWADWSFYIPEDFRKKDSQFILGLVSDDDENTDDGIYWDNIGICAISDPTDTYESLDGTSMAAPFVTGLAALIWAKEPQLSYLEVKERILKGVDIVPQLKGLVASSGRINAYKALTGLYDDGENNGGSNGGDGDPYCIPPFIDVSCDYWATNYIIAVKNAGITRGCNPPQNDMFCPEDIVTRAQMAAFIIRTIEGEPTSYNTNPYFSDVPSTHWAFKYIQRVKERNIAQGYAGTTLYGPEDNVTREQMAKMLIMGLVSQGKTSEPPTDYCSTGAPFDDVSPSSWSCRYIKKLKELGITQGCNPPDNNRYCPQNPVTRAQMATFIYRGFLQ